MRVYPVSSTVWTASLKYFVKSQFNCFTELTISDNGWQLHEKCPPQTLPRPHHEVTNSYHKLAIFILCWYFMMIESLIQTFSHHTILVLHAQLTKDRFSRFTASLKAQSSLSFLWKERQPDHPYSSSLTVCQLVFPSDGQSSLPAALRACSENIGKCRRILFISLFMCHLLVWCLY